MRCRLQKYDIFYFSDKNTALMKRLTQLVASATQIFVWFVIKCCATASKLD